jgi:RHS repeat-associated protein
VNNRQTLGYHHWTNPLNNLQSKTIIERTDYDNAGRATGSRKYILDGILHFTSGAQLDVQTAITSTSTLYDDSGRVEQTSNSFGTLTFNRYDNRGLMVETRTQSKREDGTPTWIVTRTAYDSNGRPEYTTDSYLDNDPSDAADEAVRGSRTVYDALGRVKDKQRLDGLLIRITGTAPAFSAQVVGTPTVLATASTAYDNEGRIFSTTSETGLTTFYKYDATGQATDVIYGIDLNQNGSIAVSDVNADGIPDSGAELIQTTSTFDDGGRQVKVVDALQHVTSFDYDRRERFVRTIYHNDTSTTVVTDERGREIRRIDQLNRPIDYEYDDQGRLTAVMLPPIDENNRRPRYEYHYDVYGNPTAMVSNVYLAADGTTIIYQRKDANGDDLQDATRSITDAPLLEGQVTTFTNDHLGRRLTRTLPLGQNGGGFTERMVYDDRPVAGLATPQASAALGQLSYTIDFAGRVTQMLYDNTPAGGGRVVEKRYFTNEAAFNNGNGTPAERVVYTYNGLHQLMRTVQDHDGNLVSTPDQHVTDYAYDADGHSTRITTTRNGASHAINYVYNNLGLLTRTYTGNLDVEQASTNGDGKAITDTRYTYDTLGRLITVSVHERQDQRLGTLETSTYRYDKVGNLDLVKQSNRVVSDYTYDELNRLLQLVHFFDANNDFIFNFGDQSKGSFVYGLNADGSRRTATERNELQQLTVFTWQYDGLRRLTSEAINSYDNNLDGTATYAYDIVGNRLSKIGGPANDAGTIRYVYDDNDRLLREVFDIQGDGTPERTTVYSYGAGNGGVDQTLKTVWQGANTNPATGIKVTETSFSYNLQGQLASSTIATYSGGMVSSTVTITYAYDDNGIRVEQRTDEGGSITTQNYLIDPENHTGHAQVIEEFINNALATTFTIGHDILTQHTNATGPLTFLYDGHGSTRALLNAAAGVAQRYAYDAYGKMLSGLNLTAASAALTSLLYSGEMLDVRLGMQYLRARYYDPATGRFNQFDKFQGGFDEPWSLHKYLYAGADPVSNVDPTGEFFGSLVETLAVAGIWAAHFAVRLYPVIKLGLMVWSAVSFSKILYKGFTQGWDKVSAGEYVELGVTLFTLGTLGPGAKLAKRLVANVAIRAVLRIPLGPAMRKFDDVRDFVGQFARLETKSWAEVLKDGAWGGFSGKFGPVITYYRTGDSLKDARTLIHEFIHYRHWRLSGSPKGAAWDAFKDRVRSIEYGSGPGKGIFEKITDLVMELSK